MPNVVDRGQGRFKVQTESIVVKCERLVAIEGSCLESKGSLSEIKGQLRKSQS